MGIKDGLKNLAIPAIVAAFTQGCALDTSDNLKAAHEDLNNCNPTPSAIHNGGCIEAVVNVRDAERRVFEHEQKLSEQYPDHRP